MLHRRVAPLSKQQRPCEFEQALLALALLWSKTNVAQAADFFSHPALQSSNEVAGTGPMLSRFDVTVAMEKECLG